MIQEEHLMGARKEVNRSKEIIQGTIMLPWTWSFREGNQYGDKLTPLKPGDLIKECCFASDRLQAPGQQNGGFNTVVWLVTASQV